MFCLVTYILTQLISYELFCVALVMINYPYKKQVDKIVLLAGDSDFVPAAKLARREGIDFVLDSLGRKIKDDLFEHIDGLRCCDDKLKIQNNR